MSSFVLIDAPSVVATLLASRSPRPVQVVIGGVSAGQSVTVTAVAGGVHHAVPGGVIESAPGGQIVLVDNRSPLNMPVHYQVVIDGLTYLSNEVVVAHAGEGVLQSLDGREVVDLVLQANGLPRAPVMRSVTFDVPGRSRPPGRFDLGGDGGGALEISTDEENSRHLDRLLKSGRPVVVRTNGRWRDFPPVEIVLPQAAASRLIDTVKPGGREMDTRRAWSIPYLLVDDPEPSSALSAFTGADFNEAMEGRTGADFNALFAASTGADFDTYQWSQL